MIDAALSSSQHNVSSVASPTVAATVVPAAAFNNMSSQNHLSLVPNLPYLPGTPSAPTTPAATNPQASPPAVASSPYVNIGTVLNQKDSRWLQLEVCREFQRSKCTRSDLECKFAHPNPSIEVQSGKVTACYDSIKGRCNRDKPPCKYFHPPQHLKDQLLINGRNHLALKNAIMQQAGMPAPNMVPNQPASMVLGPSIPPAYTLPLGYFANPPTAVPFGYSIDQFAAMGMMNDAMAPFAGCSPGAAMLRVGAGLNNPLQRQFQAAALAHQTAASVWNGQAQRGRSDRVEVCREFRRGFCTRSINECRFAHPAEGVNISEDGSVTICMDHEKGRCARDPCRYFHRPEHMKKTLSAKSSNFSLVTNTLNQPVYHQQQVAGVAGVVDPQRTPGVNASLLV